jgi:hypothetical protein
LGSNTPPMDSHPVAALGRRLRQLGWIGNRTAEEWADDSTFEFAPATDFVMIQPKLFAISFNCDQGMPGGVNCFQRAGLMLLRQRRC